MAIAVRRQPFSWVPKPSSAGCMPSETKPSTDQVLTNLPRGLGALARWVSRSAMWMPLMPTRCISAAHSSRVFGSPAETPVSRATSSSACLTNQDTMPGLAPQQFTAVTPPGRRRRRSSTRSRSA